MWWEPQKPTASHFISNRKSLNYENCCVTRLTRVDKEEVVVIPTS